jgi:hypothetical protein
VISRWNYSSVILSKCVLSLTHLFGDVVFLPEDRHFVFDDGDYGMIGR